MKLKVLFEDRFRILAVMDGDGCPVEAFLDDDEPACTGLLHMLEVVAELGLEGVSSKWFHEVSKADKISEFIKGNLRLFFFKGRGRDIAVCVECRMKKGQKADKGAVARAASTRARYYSTTSIEVIEE